MMQLDQSGLIWCVVMCIISFRCVSEECLFSQFIRLVGRVIDLQVIVSVSLFGCRKKVFFFGRMIFLFIMWFSVVLILVFGLFKLINGVVWLWKVWNLLFSCILIVVLLICLMGGCGLMVSCFLFNQVLIFWLYRCMGFFFIRLFFVCFVVERVIGLFFVCYIIWSGYLKN